MKINIIRAIIIILLIGTFFLIFGFSNEDATKSSSRSKEISETIVNITRKKESKEEKNRIVKIIEPRIRKIAHFLIYTLVGVLSMSLFSTYNLKEKNRVLISLLIGAIYAATDEIHQSFVPGRGPQATDVIIDTMGTLMGTLLVLVIIKLFQEIKEKNVKKRGKMVEK